MLGRVGPLLLAAVCAACTVGPEPRRPDVAVPTGWSRAGEGAFDTDLPSRAVEGAFDGRRWWSVFNDPVLDRLVAAAAAQSLDLQQTALRIEAARAQRDAAAGAFYPNVEGSGLAGRSRMSENGISKALGGSSGSSGSSSGSSSSSGGASAKPPSTFDLFQAGFDATWELDLFGKTRRNVQAANADIRSAEDARRDALVSLTAEVARSYLSLRGSERQREIALADIATEERLLQLVTSRRRSGLAAESDTVTQQTQLDAARAELPPLVQAIGQSRNRLALLLALPPGGVDTLLGAPAEQRLPPEVPVGLPGDLLRRRPDILKSEADLHAATAKVGQAKAQLFPSITLGGTAGFQSVHADSLTDWASRFWVGGAQVSIPIFEGGKLKAQIRTADAQMREAALNWRGTVLAAYHDANNALVAYADEQRHAGALARQLADARRADALMRSRHRSGFVSMIEVLDAQRNVHQAEQQALQSNVAASTDLVALYKALGGDWNEDAGANVASAGR
jgi:NodT family efflux transporter outer membrane factor (OMF) lipoprotein